MPQWQADEEPGSSAQQKPAVFLLSIRPNKQKPCKLADVKRIARNEQPGLTSVSVAVHLPCLMEQKVDFLLLSGKMVHSTRFFIAPHDLYGGSPLER
jgi:hypothetical protein